MVHILLDSNRSGIKPGALHMLIGSAIRSTMDQLTGWALAAEQVLVF